MLACQPATADGGTSTLARLRPQLFVIVEDGVGLRPPQSEVHPVALTLASLLDLYLKVTEAASLRNDVRICFN
jgi:hypothetical protein